MSDPTHTPATSTTLGPVLVTGASGFIGDRLRARLTRTAASVRGLDFQTDLKRGIVAADISERDGLPAAFAGHETVIHAAAATRRGVTRDIAWRTNVLGTRNAIEAAISAGATRFVHLSTARVYGELDEEADVEETQPVRLSGDPFTDSKIAAEQVVLQAQAAGEIDCVILRPGDVYGPGARQWTVRPVEAIRSNRFVLPAKGNGVFSPLYVDNLLDAIELACSAPDAPGAVLNVTDGRGMPCREFFGHYARMLGKGSVPVVPTLAALGLAAVPEAAARIGGTDAEATRATMRHLARPATYSIGRARKVLGYEPTVDLERGMAETEAWLREHGLLR
ncbi:MAG: NAD-dependent epimerase/dehydratase family protein [Solirubrobacterales bacterium]